MSMNIDLESKSLVLQGKAERFENCSNFFKTAAKVTALFAIGVGGGLIISALLIGTGGIPVAILIIGGGIGSSFVMFAISNALQEASKNAHSRKEEVDREIDLVRKTQRVDVIRSLYSTQKPPSTTYSQSLDTEHLPELVTLYYSPQQTQAPEQLRPDASAKVELFATIYRKR